MTELQPPSKSEFDQYTPHDQGYASYMFAAWPNSEIPDHCPFTDPSDIEQWKKGRWAAYIAVIDVDD